MYRNLKKLIQDKYDHDKQMKRRFNQFLEKRVYLRAGHKKKILQKPKKKYKIPASVKEQAKLSKQLKRLGFRGGTKTGWDRATQLINNEYISEDTAVVMRNWFARHGPDAKNGGTSYPGYVKWIKNKKPTDKKAKNNSRGAVAWLLWGGTPAYKWIKKICPKPLH